MKTFDRIENARIALRLNKGEMCKQLGIGRTMMHYLKTEERNLSMTELRKLEAIEEQAGVSPTRFSMADRSMEDPAREYHPENLKQMYYEQKARADQLEKELAELRKALEKLGQQSKGKS